MAECEWGSCHVLMVFPLRNVEESFPVWSGGFPTAGSELLEIIIMVPFLFLYVHRTIGYLKNYKQELFKSVDGSRS